ncbi:transcriptional repressor general negative regulator of transcription subunit 4 [Mortierella sp. GBA30]|nr:transcriptional repressor general negative regulator of transcription subunit 4 [Mortierella sp. GBA30]
MSDEEDFDCPLCMEELDISDRNFRPCPCGYQICRFCWHHIKEDLNGRCPACRRVYSEETVEFTPISADELAMIKNEKKAKEREKKEIDAMNRKHLANMRVVQKSLVYVIGLPTKLANDEHTLRQNEYFGQYGRIAKVVINRRNAPMPSGGSSPGQASVGVYITYVRKEDAAKAIAAIDGSIWDGKILRASYGTTKYCTYYLRGMSCQNPGCMYLHEPGEDADSYTKEDLAVGKHHLQEHTGPYDPYTHKPAVLGRPPLSSHGSSSSLTPRPRPATAASFHSSTSSMSDWPAPGGDKGSGDKDEEGSALPATASWAKIGSNPSTPTLHSSTPLSRKPEVPPPLRSKGSTTSIITGVVVNNGKRKELNYTKDGSIIESPVVDSPTPAEALAIEAAAKQQMLQEQRQLQEQQRKQQQLLQKQQQEAEQQAELLNQKLLKQKLLEQEREQQELQKQKQQQEMELKMQKQKEKELQRKELLRQEQLQREKEEREKAQREQELKEENETKEKERREKERQEEERLRNEKEQREKEEKEQNEREERENGERERKEREAKEEQERKERKEQEEKREKEEKERQEKEMRLVQQPILSLGSFSFNPDASLSTLPPAFGNGAAAAPLGTEAAGPFGLDSFPAISNLPLTPTHYTGSFNPFSMEDEPLMRRSIVPPSRSFLDDSDHDSAKDHSRPVGPPIPGKPRQTSRFGFAMDNQYSDSLERDTYAPPTPVVDRTLTRDSFRALFPNVNVSFGQSDGLMNLQQQQQLHQQPHQHHQQHQQSQQSMYRSPLLQRQEAAPDAGLWGSSDKHENLSYQRSMNQLNMDPMLTTPSSRMTEYHQQLSMQPHQDSQQHQQQLQQPARSNGPPGLSRSSITPTMVKSPPPGLESLVRHDFGVWPGPQQHHQQQQEQQQRHHQTSRLNSWNGETQHMSSNDGVRNTLDSAQDFFGAFLKAAAASPSNNSPSVSNTPGLPTSVAFQDPAIMSARISSSGASRPSLADALQQPPIGGSGYSGAFGMGLSPSSPMSDIHSPMLQQFGLGRRIEPQHYSPLHKAANLNIDGYPPTAFGAGESPLLNTINSAAAARSAKVRSDLLMGLNAGIRPERLSMKEYQPSTSMPTGSLSEEHNNMLNSLNGGLRMNSSVGGNSNSNFNFSSMFGNAGGNGYAGAGGDYASRAGAQYEGLGMNGGYGMASNGLNGPMHSMSLPMSSTGSGPVSVSGPPPGLGLLANSNSGNNNARAPNGSFIVSGENERGPGMASFARDNNNSSNKPLDITSMMSNLDFFGPSSSVNSSNIHNNDSNWSSLANSTNSGHMGYQHHQDMSSRRESAQSNPSQQQQQRYGNLVNGSNNGDNNSETNTGPPTPRLDSSSENGAASSASASATTTATARSVEDLELQVINAKMETQMLENQLNAVIKRNRRKLYA